MKSNAELFALLDRLVDGWCERRVFRPLSIVLQAYPMSSSLSDSWYKLRGALRKSPMPPRTGFDAARGLHDRRLSSRRRDGAHQHRVEGLSGLTSPVFSLILISLPAQLVFTVVGSHHKTNAGPDPNATDAVWTPDHRACCRWWRSGPDARLFAASCRSAPAIVRASSPRVAS